VGDNRVARVLFEVGERSQAVFAFDDRMALVRQQDPQVLSIQWIVVSDQDLHVRSSAFHFRSIWVSPFAGPCGSVPTGSVKLNVVSFPSSLSTEIFPPCASIIILQITKPDPVPFSCRAHFDDSSIALHQTD